MEANLLPGEPRATAGFDLDMEGLQTTIDARLRRIARQERVLSLLRVAAAALPGVVLLLLFLAIS